jgi:hypothetical protein
MDELTLEDLAASLRHDDADVRRNAAWLLGRMRDERIVPPLIGALDDPDAGVRLRAAQALASFRDSRAVGPLLARLATEDDPETRAQIVTALGRQGAVEASEPLIAALSDPDARARMAAAEALGMLGEADEADSRVVALMAAFSGDADADVRYEVGRALTHYPGELLAGPLTALLTADPAPDAGLILRALEIVGGARVDNPALAAVVARYVDHPDPAVAETASWALKRLGGKRPG